ncbi:hypothetical protein NXT08_22340 [Rhodococcus pyridinivorans]|uniref:hypothetical protein n=1 Tax=Rhodococcus pyridinivorans TaxID=103816 RepID=UPI00216433EC|nr:hypothetical protein [Rhodococcus pyridinivorans]UVT24943.1 hypothetical protein NXT08_22340 [Rhodococcus pyridinivorans]
MLNREQVFPSAPIDTDEGWAAYRAATDDLDRPTTGELVLYIAILIVAALCFIAAIAVAQSGGW